MIALALALWGWFLPTNITYQYVDHSYDYGPYVAWAENWDTNGEHCVISIWPRYWDRLPPAHQQRVIVHEVGHCLGLNHIERDSVMKGSAFEFSVWDRVEFWRVHPAPYRTVVPMLSH